MQSVNEFLLVNDGAGESGEVNRAFRYGDGFFETMRYCKGKIPLADWHQRRLLHTASLLGYNLPEILSSGEWLQQALELLRAKENTDYKIRLQLWREGGHGYLPDEGKARWQIDASVYQPRSEKIRLMGFVAQSKASGSLSRIKSCSALLYAEALRHVQLNHANEAIIFNERGRVAEGAFSSIFIQKDGKLITPSLNEGATDGVFRAWVLKKFPERVSEGSLWPEDIENAELVLMANALHGWMAVEMLEGDARRGEIPDYCLKMNPFE
jgi:branched-chain amino acid aminotransferase